MNVYQVGGAVRDQLLGRPVQDRDWVVVGATPQEMLNRGFRQVGADFPVFLDPETNEEFALARLERKSAPGYHGFEVQIQSVTLEEDLSRRDLTINAMAMAKNGQLIDPFNGKSDLEQKILRHVGDAFVEDPVRILRVLRFLARFGPSWRVADETAALIQRMVAGGEASHLVAERVWKETERALMEPHPELYVRGLLDYGLTELPCFAAFRFAHRDRLDALAAAADASAGLEARFAIAFGSPALGLDVHGVPNAPILASYLATELLRNAAWWATPAESGADLLQFLTRAQVFKHEALFQSLLEVLSAMGIPTAKLEAAAARVRAVDTKGITKSMPAGPAVGLAIFEARLTALTQI